MEKTTLTDAEIKAIRRLKKSGEKQTELAKKYRVSNSRISKICAGKSHNPHEGWAGLPDYWV
mgnify:CR=1 FL=1